MAKDKKGNERKEYPKLVKLETGKKVLVNSKEEEAKITGKRLKAEETKEEKKEEKKEGEGNKAGWGAK